ATALGRGGILSLDMAPSLGLIMPGVGQFIQAEYNEAMTSAEQEVLIAATISAMRALEPRLMGEVGQHFATLSAQLQKAVAGHYAAGIAHIRAVLEENLAHRRNE